MLVQFGNNWIQKNSSDSQIGLGLRPRPILAVLGIFFIQLFPNWTACSPINYFSCRREYPTPEVKSRTSLETQGQLVGARGKTWRDKKLYESLQPRRLFLNLSSPRYFSLRPNELSLGIQGWESA